MGETIVDWWDPKLEVGIGEVELRQQLAAWAEQHAYTALAVVGYKRRLGQVSNEELAQDKKVARQVAYRFIRLLEVAQGEQCNWLDMRLLATQDAEARSRAAVVRWEPWLTERITESLQRRTLLATWVMSHGLGNSGMRFMAKEVHNAGIVLGKVLGTFE